MPKETIGAGDASTELEISWGVDASYVQIGTTSREALVTHTMPREPVLELPDCRLADCERAARYRAIVCPLDSDRSVGETRDLCERHLGDLAGWDVIALQDRVPFPFSRPVDDIPFPGFYVQMSRHDINRAITVLRRARNSVYGGDE